MSPPTSYDPASENEQEVALPSASRYPLAPNVFVQPPLSRRGYGPSLVLVLPSLNPPPPIGKDTPTAEQIDPEPVQKWAEEGFSVLAVYAPTEGAWPVTEALSAGLPELAKWQDPDDDDVVKDKAAMIVYDESLLPPDFGETPLPIKVLVVYSPSGTFHSSIPTLTHSTAPTPPTPAKPRDRVYTYDRPDPFFTFPGHTAYEYRLAGIAHARSLSWIKKGLNGPWFDLEAIWEEHTAYEFETRSVAKTMGTMVAEPYVNHGPTITGGVGRRNLTAFYRDHFIFSNPKDVKQTMVSRCVGMDRIAEEFTFSFTHDQPVDWLLPGVPPTYKKLDIPMQAFVSIRGDRLYHEHIYWDQATAYRQVGLLGTHVAFQNQDMHEPGKLRLPTADGTATTRMLLAVGSVKSNQMFGWGLES